MQRRGYHRTLCAGSASALLVLATVLIPGGASGAEEPWVNGSTKATALVSKIAPGVGSLELATTGGVAVSETRNDLAQAQAQALDLGLVGTTLTAESCDDAPLRPDQLPQPLRVDNRKGSAEASDDEAPLAESGLGGGRKQVSATQQPKAHAAVTGVASALDPVIQISGGRAEATAQVIDDQAREAHATSQASVTIAGLVELSNMRWDAVHRTGADPTAVGTFSIGSASGAAAPSDLTQLEAVESAVNTALALSGISIDMPRIERLKKPNDLVRVTPMRIMVKDSELGALLVGPLLNASREQREDFFDQAAAAFCQAAGALLVGDIGLAVAGGNGFIRFDIGGAEAMTAEIRYEDPFGSDAPVVGGTTNQPPPVTGTTTTTPRVRAPTAGTPGRVIGGRNVAAGPTRDVCESIHPFKWPDCSRGAAVPLGLIGLAATAAVAAVDWRHQRALRIASGFARDPI